MSWDVKCRVCPENCREAQTLTSATGKFIEHSLAGKVEWGRDLKTSTVIGRICSRRSRFLPPRKKLSAGPLWIQSTFNPRTAEDQLARPTRIESTAAALPTAVDLQLHTPAYRPTLPLLRFGISYVPRTWKKSTSRISNRPVIPPYI